MELSSEESNGLLAFMFAIFLVSCTREASISKVSAILMAKSCRETLSPAILIKPVKSFFVNAEMGY